MGTRRNPGTGLPAPYLRRISWARPDELRPKDYPFCLPYLDDPGWSVGFTTPVTIIMGENRGGSVCLNRCLAFSKWISASVMPLPLRALAG